MKIQKKKKKIFFGGEGRVGSGVGFGGIRVFCENSKIIYFFYGGVSGGGGVRSGGGVGEGGCKVWGRWVMWGMGM